MSAGWLFVLSTVAIWAGFAFFARGCWLGIGWLVSPSRDPVQAKAGVSSLTWGGVLLVLGATLPHTLGRPEPPAFWVPVLWPVMPFPAWFILLALVMSFLEAFKAFSALNREESTKRWTAVMGWFAFALLNAAWFRAMGERPQLLRGAVPFSLPAALGLAALLVAAMVFVRWSARAFRLKGLAVTTAKVLALVVGSSVFCLPLFWMLLTSFKEKQDNTGSGLVWVPMVTVQHTFYDGDPPLVSADWNGKKVTGTVVGATKDGKVQIDVERPFPLRGWRVDVPQSGLRQEARHGAVVDATYQGRPVQAFVRRELVGGEREVQILSPESEKDKIFTTSETKPVRKFGLRWENYTEAVEWLPPETGNGLQYLKNTVWLVLMSVVGTLLSCSLVAYGFSRIRFPGRKALFGLMVSTMMLPGAVTMLPRFLIWRGLGAVDTLVPIWLPAFTASAFNVFLLREFFKTVPVELEDAAKMDGCSPLRTYWQVMLPQIKPALTVIAIWTFMGAWNDFMGPLIYVSSAEKMPLAYAVQLFATDKGSEFGLLMAFSTMATVPVLLVFLFGQRYFVEGVQLSGLGGK